MGEDGCELVVAVIVTHDDCATPYIDYFKREMPEISKQGTIALDGPP